MYEATSIGKNKSYLTSVSRDNHQESVVITETMKLNTEYYDLENMDIISLDNTDSASLQGLQEVVILNNEEKYCEVVGPLLVEGSSNILEENLNKCSEGSDEVQTSADFTYNDIITPQKNVQ